MEYVLKVENLSKSYETFALKNINIEVPSGSIVGFIGENGAGKTSTIKAIIGAIQKDAGSVKLFGKPFQGEVEVKQQIAVVMEGSFFSEEFTVVQIERILKGMYTKWNAVKFASYLEKFRVPTTKKVKDFSKGMRMKLSLAIALSYDAKLLILDEPTSGLDPIVRNEILDEFLAFIQDEERGVLLSSHITTDLEKVADYIAFIHNGELILSEEKDTLLYEYGVLKCGASEFAQLDLADVIGYQKSAFQVEALVKNKAAMQRKYPQFVMDTASIEDIMMYYVRGAKG